MIDHCTNACASTVLLLTHSTLSHYISLYPYLSPLPKHTPPHPTHPTHPTHPNHPIPPQAVSVGARAGVYRTLLTHFSQRYPRIPVINKSYRHNTCIAFDLMTIRFRDLPGLPDLVPRLKRVFEDSIPGDDKEGEDVAVPFSATD